jgi:hypothetical protein
MARPVRIDPDTRPVPRVDPERLKASATLVPAFMRTLAKHGCPEDYLEYGLMRTTVHEAGHAMNACCWGVPVTMMAITEFGYALTRVTPHDDRAQISISIDLAGVIAEEILAERKPEVLTYHALRNPYEWRDLSGVDFDSAREIVARKRIADDTVSGIIRKTRRRLRANWCAVMRLSELLAERFYLGPEDLEKFMPGITTGE